MILWIRRSRKGKTNSTVIEAKTVLTSAGMVEIEMSHEGTFRYDGNILYCDLSGNYILNTMQYNKTHQF